MQPRFSLEELRAQDPELARSLRNPLRMRMFMECMHREPLTGELREQDVFSRYLEGLRVAHAQVDVQGLLTALGRIMYRNLSISIELHELERECHDLVYRREGTSALFVLEHRGVLSKTSDRDGRAYTFAIERVAEQVIGEYLAGLPEAATPSGLAEIAKRIAGGRFAQGPGAVQVALDQRMSACTRDDADDFLLGFIDSCPESLASLASSALEARILKSGQAGAALIVEMLLEDPTPSDVEVALRAAFRLRDRERHDLAVAFLEPWVTEERVSEAATDERYAQLAAEYVAAVARLLEGDPEDRDAEGVGRAQRVIEVLRHGADHGTSSVHLRELVNALSAAACADPASGLCDDPTGLLREAAEAARRRLAAFPGDDARDQAAGALEQLGTRLAQSGAHDEGERCLLEALSLHGGTRSSWSPCPALWQLAKICEHRGDASGALRHLRACADEELRRQWWWHAAITESRIGDVLQEAGNHDEAVRQHFKAVERARNSGNPPQHAIALGWLGSTLRRARRLPEALDAFERALHVAGSTPFIEPETKSDILEAKARVHSDLEDHDAAVSLRRQAIDLLRDSADRRRLVISLEHLGHALQRAGCHREAIEAFAESHELGTAPEPLDDWSPAVSLGGQAKSHVALGEFQPAIGLRLQIIDCMRSQGDRRGESIAVEHLGHTLREAGKDREAIEAYMRSHQVGMEPEPAEDWNPSVSLSYAATCHAKLGEFEPAVGLRARVAEISRASGDLREWALDLERLGDTLQEARRFDEALDAYRQALAAGIGPPEAEDWSAASVHAEIARVHEAREEWELALQARRHETDWCRDRGDRRSHAIAVEFLGHTLRKAGRVREAIEAYMESHRIGMVPEPVERWNPSISLNRAAGCHVELRDLDAAIGVRKQAIEASEARGDRRQLAIDLEFLGDTLREAERFDEALDAYRRALEAGLGPPAAEEWSAASVHSEIARVHEARGEWDLALQTRRQALEWRLRSDDRRATTVAHEYVAHALRELGRYREAIAEYMRSYEVGMEPETVGDWNPGVSLSFAATCHAELGEFDAAIVLRHQVIRISKAQGDRCECAIDLEQLGDTLREAKRYDEALDAYRQALETGLGPPMAEGWPADSVHAEIARVHEIRQEWDRAIDARRLQVDWCREHADRRAHAIALEFLGYTLRKAGRIREAIDAYMESHRIGMAPEPVERWNPSLSLRQCAQCHAEAGDLEAALAVRRQATRIGQDGGDRREWAIDLELLGDTLQEAERFDEALDAYRQALRAGLEPSIAEGWSAATVHTEIARVHEARQAWDSAVEAHRQALEWWQRSDDRRGRTIAHAFLAHALRKVGRQREAIAEYMRSHEVGMEPEPVERWDPGVSLKLAADCHATLGEFEAAIELLLRAVESDRARGDRRNHAIAMEALGRTYGEAGMHQEAVSAYLDSYRIGTSPEPVANWNPVIPLHLAAEECREHGDGETAVELAMQAMDCASACENQLWIALAALSLSESLESAGRDPDDVLAAATRAMQVAESNWLPGEGGPIGSRLLLGCANRIGRRLLARSGPCEALEAVESARAAAMEITESPSTASPGERAEAADWWQLQADGLGAIGDHAEARAAEARAAELRQ
jgi:tetratricopeptide (TPR) repeat protein